MKKINALFIIVLLLGLVGCTSVPPTLQTPLAPKDYTVLGRVSVSTTNFSILGIGFNSGREGYNKLYKEAEKKYKNFDEIVNIYTDDSYMNIYLFFGKNTRTISGLVIKYKN